MTIFRELNNIILYIVFQKILSLISYYFTLNCHVEELKKEDEYHSVIEVSI